MTDVWIGTDAIDGPPFALILATVILPQHDACRMDADVAPAGRRQCVVRRSLWQTALQPERTQFHILSFEGPDPYATVGGLGTRVSGLTEALAALGHETHLWIVGDPDQPGHETRGKLVLHRWCQWISEHHPGGVYDGEQGKAVDYATSLPPFMLHRVLLPHLLAGGHAVVIAEEWQTANALLHLDWLLRRAGLRHRVSQCWNANNTYGFDQIAWPRLDAAATITTVSRSGVLPRLSVD